MASHQAHVTRAMAEVQQGRLVLQLGDFNWVVQFDAGKEEQKSLLMAVHSSYRECIKPDDRLTMQIKDDEWDVFCGLSWRRCCRPEHTEGCAREC